MKKNLLAVLILVMTLSSSQISGFQKKASEPEPRMGQAAAESSENSLKWGIAIGGTAAFMSAFGLIIYLASSDPSTFGHCFSHCHAN